MCYIKAVFISDLNYIQGGATVWMMSALVLLVFPTDLLDVCSETAALIALSAIMNVGSPSELEQLNLDILRARCGLSIAKRKGYLCSIGCFS